MPGQWKRCTTTCSSFHLGGAPFNTPLRISPGHNYALAQDDGETIRVQHVSLFVKLAPLDHKADTALDLPGHTRACASKISGERLHPCLLALADREPLFALLPGYWRCIRSSDGVLASFYPEQRTLSNV